MQSLSLRSVSVSYGNKPVLQNIDLDIPSGEIVCLIGASGCGKSTLLNVVAGLVPASAGQVELAGHQVTGPGSDRVMVFQDDAVFPWMTVQQNVEYGLRIQGIPKPKRRGIAEEKIRQVELTGWEDAFPRQLSGGMRKRVDLARALAVTPRVILMDEPYGALDAMTKERLQKQFLDVCKQSGATALFVTHDLEEALFLGDRVVVLGRNPGHIAEILDVPFGTARDVAIKRDPDFQALRGHLNDLIH